MITVRPAHVSEREFLEALQWRASLANPGDRAALRANPDAIELSVEQIEVGRVFVAESGGVVVGFAAVLPRADGDLELDALFVEPAVWRRGVGRALVERCCQVASAAGCSFLYLLGNPHAEAFYRSCDFTVFGAQQTRFGNGLLMKRSLT